MKNNILDVLLDDENKSPIILEREDGAKLRFEQIAVIPYEVNGDEKIYCVLKPIDEIEGIADDEAVVFVVDETNGEPILKVEDDIKIAETIFKKYYELLEQSNKKKKGKHK